MNRILAFTLSCIALLLFACNRDTPSPLDDLLQTNKQTVSLNGNASSKDSIQITSNTTWTINIPSNVSWIQLEPSSGTGNETIVISSTEENTGSARTADIEIKTTSGGKSVSVAVSQSKIDSTLISVIGDGQLNGVTETSDGNFIAVGVSDDMHLWVTQFDREGNKKWSKLFGSGNGVSVSRMSSGNYLVLAIASNENADIASNTSDNDAWLLSIDGNGNLLWEKKIGGSGLDELHCMKPLSDGNFLLGGFTNSDDHDIHLNHGAKDAWLVKMNSQAEIIWEKTYGGSNVDEIFDATPLSDGGIIFSGRTHSMDGDLSNRSSEETAAWYGKVTSDGSLSLTSYLETPDILMLSAIEASNGDILLGGTASTPGFFDNPRGARDAFVCRVDGTGNLTWKKAFGGSDNEIFYTLTTTSDGNIIIGGKTKSSDGDFSENFGGFDAMLIRINGEGAVIGSKVLGGVEDDDAFRIIGIGNNRFAFIGNTSSFGNDPGSEPRTHGWFVVTDF